MLEQLKAYELERSSWQHLHVYAEVLRRAHATRRFSVCDPDALSEGELVSRKRQWKNAMTWLGPHPIDPKHATASKTLWHPESQVNNEHEQTTHFSVIDHEGMAVSCTMTLSSGFGAKIVAPTTGVVLNNTAAAFATSGDNTVRPGRRPISSMAPAIVVDSGGVLLVLGSPGGSTIPSTIVQVLRNIVDYSMPLDEAIDAFRVHHGIFPDHFRFEGERPPPQAALRGLRLAGHRFSPSRIPMGDANCLLVGDGEAWGYADPREGGLALAAKLEPEH
jgi:gamma-glutamyltranspeptidase/glutathione hydrolase